MSGGKPECGGEEACDVNTINKMLCMLCMMLQVKARKRKTSRMDQVNAEEG